MNNSLTETHVILGCGTTKCDPRDADQVMTHMVQERGRISQWIWQSVAESDVFLKILGKTKEFFPSGMGDTKREVILDVPGPNEKDVLDWQRVGMAKPGYNPCCFTYKTIHDRCVTCVVF